MADWDLSDYTGRYSNGLTGKSDPLIVAQAPLCLVTSSFDNFDNSCNLVISPGDTFVPFAASLVAADIHDPPTVLLFWVARVVVTLAFDALLGLNKFMPSRGIDRSLNGLTPDETMIVMIDCQVSQEGSARL